MNIPPSNIQVCLPMYGDFAATRNGATDATSAQASMPIQRSACMVPRVEGGVASSAVCPRYDWERVPHYFPTKHRQVLASATSVVKPPQSLGGQRRFAPPQGGG